ncbi:hypothetical protein TVAG_388440 [Trichomonas vaginalis G3]|uniref:Uncharacterized protein n=1 Tax=Trichomonas vaginalis (strain ATCC PRA-98 / G3) TaxID=412133 RepID=A2DYH8_TRIV3|nr:hypothetical protein TVAGG3_0321230 [Trichomonas vaginalis G3]EAY14513.1 hypothetical protein TVAG_388440 [Trichomonas vaginalis G3]KAI5529314.1 hypothetical protein TVAGG3_0321230 [Trichomonas vaginalis G3]|eukprot:XP_001326736.1 hypothetical protein [Trichomonas vaginalis G3]
MFLFFLSLNSCYEKKPIAESNDLFSCPDPLSTIKDEIAGKDKDYIVQDLSSIVDTVANEFHLERDRVELFFRRCKHSFLSKQLFNRVDMTQPDIKGAHERIM